MRTVAEKWNASPSSGSSFQSMSGCSIGFRRLTPSASAYQRSRCSRRVSSSTSSRPRRCEDDLRRHSALAESGHPDLVREMSQRVLEIVLDALRRNLDIEARAVTVEEGGLRPHGSQTVAEAPGSSGGLEHSSATALVWPPRGRGGTVDAPDLGSGERELVEVQVLSPALACWRRARRNGSRAQYHRRRAGDRRSCRPVRAGQVARRGRPGSRAPAGTRGGGCARLDRCERPHAGDRARRPVRLQRVR